MIDFNRLSFSSFPRYPVKFKFLILEKLNLKKDFLGLKSEYFVFWPIIYNSISSFKSSSLEIDFNKIKGSSHLERSLITTILNYLLSSKFFFDLIPDLE